MKKIFYLLIGLVMLPALLYAQGTLSVKDLLNYVTANYYTKTVSDSKYATSTDISAKADKTYVDANFATTAENALKQNIADMVDYYTKTATDLLLADKADTDSVYTKAAVDILLGMKADLTYVNETDENIINTLLPLKADLTYVNATDEAIMLDDDSQDVAINATNIKMTSAEVAINLNNIDDDSQDVTIEANKVGVASVEVGLQTHQNKATGAHAATAISATWTNVQVSLDSIEAAIQGIVVGSGFALESWVNSTLETNFYTQAQTNATIEAAIAAIPTGGGTAIEDEGIYISNNAIWEFDTTYDTTAVCIYRNRLLQPRKLFTSSVVSGKTRVTFLEPINASDEIILISNK